MIVGGHINKYVRKPDGASHSSNAPGFEVPAKFSWRLTKRGGRHLKEFGKAVY
jgi:hypothetical protein